MSATKQKYALYRDNELIATEVPSLAATGLVAKNDARKEYAHGRPASYTVTGSLGFRGKGCHYKGRLRWDEGKLQVKALVETGVPALPE